MNKYKLIDNYLDQLSCRSASVITELNVFQKHIGNIREALSVHNDMTYVKPETIASQPLSSVAELQQPSDPNE